MNPPTRNPVSRSANWRDFRQTVVPYLVFGSVVIFATILWRQRVGRSALVGQAEAVRATATVSQPGQIVSLKADLLQRVKRGDVLAQMVPANLEAECARIAADVEALRAQLLQSSDRSTVDFQQLRLDWLRRQVDLATARVELQFAESEFQRAVNLHKSQLVSDTEFELRRTNRDALQSKSEALNRLSTDLEKEIIRLQPSAKAGDNPADRAISAAILAQQKQLAALAEAGNIRAPMDGILTTILKRAGENALPGEPLLVLGSLQPARIIAYLRQPIERRVQVGDVVEVTSRGNGAAARARVLRVGTQLEAIDPSLLPPAASMTRVIEFGLPLLVELPAALKLAPGEVVNLNPANGG